MRSHDVPWLIFDGDCAFCTSSATWLAGRLTPSGGSERPARRLAVHRSGRARHDRGPHPARGPVGHAGRQIYGGAAAFARWLQFRGGAYAILGRLMDLPVDSRASRRRLPADREEPAPDAGRISGLRAPAARL